MLAMLAMLSGPALAADAGTEAAGAAAEEMLDAALGDLAAGRLASGCSRLELLGASWPGSAPALRGDQVARVVNGLQPKNCTFVEGSIEIATDGKTELIVTQAIVWPVWFATAAPLYFPDSVDVAPVGGLILVGLGVGIAGTYFITKDMEISTGQALMVYTAEVLGGWYGAWIEAATSDRFTGRPMHLGVLGGAGLGAVLAWQFKDASAGDIALVRSGALWGTAIGGLVAILAETDGPETFVSLGIGTSAGLALTGALTPTVELRRGQVNIINLGGYAGALAGGAVAIIVGSDDAKAAAAVIALGAGAGLGTGAYLASQDKRNRRLAGIRLPTPQVGMIADPDGKMHPGLTLAGRW